MPSNKSHENTMVHIVIAISPLIALLHAVEGDIFCSETMCTKMEHILKQNFVLQTGVCAQRLIVLI